MNNDIDLFNFNIYLDLAPILIQKNNFDSSHFVHARI